MAIANSYPIGTPKTNDLLVGTSMPTVNTDADPITKNFPISSISTLIATEIPQGVPGPAGQDGAPGANGSNGSNGAPGTNGAPGANGAQGVAGADGTSINILGTKPTFADLPATGNTVGDLWVIDQTGGGATAGDGYVWTAGNTWLNIGPLRGPQGVQGVTGTDGLPGATGAPGADGSDGADGAPGATGSQGPQGIQGPTGATGGVSSVTAGANIAVSPTVGDVVVSAPNAIVNTTDVGFTPPIVSYIVSLSQGQYNGLVSNPPITFANTLYVII
jgi:hypothetical protein